MQGECFLVFFTERLCRLFMDSLSEVGHQLALNIDNIKTIRIGTFQSAGIFQQ